MISIQSKQIFIISKRLNWNQVRNKKSKTLNENITINNGHEINK